jgi:sigma-B regulation protein RsbU (phosphoserine phosphatase)
MAFVFDAALRESLRDRRGRLEVALRETGTHPDLVRLLREVDSALDRLDHGTFGLCDECHDPIEAERLLVDPFLTTCLDHLSAAEQRALEHDLGLAAQVQGALLPRDDVRVPGFEVAFHSDPAGAVSGDYFDLIRPAAGREDTLILLGDVAGKGLAAAMLGSRLHAIFRSLAGIGLTVDELIGRANAIFCGNILSAHYATLVCVAASPAGRVTWGNAGHLPVQVRTSGTVREMGRTGLPLGVFCSTPYEIESFQLARGDTLLLYSDGLTEARDRGNDEYGIARVRGLLERHRASDANALVAAIIEDLRTFREGAPHTDDVTVLAARYVG